VVKKSFSIARILGQPLSGAVGAYYSQRDITIDQNDEKIILQPGEGIAIYQEAAGTRSAAVRVLIEWDESSNPPLAGNEYLFSFPRVENAAGTNYVYNSFLTQQHRQKQLLLEEFGLGRRRVMRQRYTLIALFL
jgi:hypothetical protein